jgi:hypothetical protein
MLDRIVIEIKELFTITQVDSAIRDLNLMGKYVEVKTDNPAFAGLIVSLIGNMNKAIIINGIVIKSFDKDYAIGEIVGWFKDFETISL